MNLLITGGTGSLGYALTERYLNSPTIQKICIYSRNEHRQEQMAEHFREHKHYNKLRFLIGDVRDVDRLKLAMTFTNLVVHAAALKIVPVAEYNPFEALKTNVLGAQNVIDAALASSYMLKVVAVSTDKAVNPINLYGASKLCAEKLFCAANNIKGQSGPIFSCVRYGNVSNSNGSVIPLFLRQLSEGKQLTVTHPEMTRFWITLEEAVNLIDRAFNNMTGGEIFVPDMPSFNVYDLAMTMMSEEYPPERQWAEIIGARPGEKLHEMIITKEEREKTLYLNEHGIYIIHTNMKPPIDVMPNYEPLTSNSSDVYRFSPAEIRAKLVELGVLCEQTPSTSSETLSTQLPPIQGRHIA